MSSPLQKEREKRRSQRNAQQYITHRSEWRNKVDKLIPVKSHAIIIKRIFDESQSTRSQISKAKLCEVSGHRLETVDAAVSRAVSVGLITQERVYGYANIYTMVIEDMQGKSLMSTSSAPVSIDDLVGTICEGTSPIDVAKRLMGMTRDRIRDDSPSGHDGTYCDVLVMLEGTVSKCRGVIVGFDKNEGMYAVRLMDTLAGRNIEEFGSNVLLIDRARIFPIPNVPRMDFRPSVKEIVGKIVKDYRGRIGFAPGPVTSNGEVLVYRHENLESSHLDSSWEDVDTLTFIGGSSD